MLSPGVDANNVHSNIDSLQPGNYGQWSGIAPRVVPAVSIRSEHPGMRSFSVPSQGPSLRNPMMILPNSGESFTPVIPTVDISESRSRSITPDIVIERRCRRHRRHCHHESSGRHQIIRIPLNNCPTLSHQGFPEQILELERVRCCRRRKHHKSRCDIEYGLFQEPTRVLLQPQSHLVATNPTYNTYVSPQDHLEVMTPEEPVPWMLSLSPEMIENLPKQTVYLPPVLLTGSQPDNNAELNNVVFPTEIVDPINGTLSIMQSNSTDNVLQIKHTQPAGVQSVRPSFTSALTNVNPSFMQSTRPQGPFMQHVQNLLQRLTPPPSQLLSPKVNASQYNTENNSRVVFSSNTNSTRPYPPANIRPINSSNNRFYDSPIVRPPSPTNTRPYAPANITPYRPVTSLPSYPTTLPAFEPANITPYPSAASPPASSLTYQPANITPYHPANITSYQPSNNLSPSSLYSPANITSYRPINMKTYRTSSVRPSYATVDISPYAPANITPYKSTNAMYSNVMDTGPYASTNITPYNTNQRFSANNVPSQPLIPSTSIASFSPSSSTRYDYLNLNPLTGVSASTKTSSSLQSLSSTSQFSTTMPKSILRNATTSSLSAITNTYSNPAITSLPSNSVRNTAFL